MKKMLLTTFATSALLLAGCSSGEEVASTKEGRINEDDLYEAMKNEPLQGGLTIGETILQQLLIEDIFEHSYGDEVSEEDVDAEIDEAAEQFGGIEEYETLLTEQGMDLESIKENIRLTLLISEAVKDNVDVDDEELEEFYEEQKPEATVQHVLVEDEDEAKDIIEQLEDGADFAEIVEEHTIDPGSAESEGVYTFQKGETQPEFEEAALELEEGETTSEPVETEFGYHVIRRLELDYGSLEDQRDDLEDMLVEQYTQDDAFMADLIAELAEDANVKISDDELSGAMEAYLNNGEEEEAPEEDFELPEDEELEDEDLEEEGSEEPEEDNNDDENAEENEEE